MNLLHVENPPRLLSDRDSYRYIHSTTPRVFRCSSTDLGNSLHYRVYPSVLLHRRRKGCPWCASLPGMHGQAPVGFNELLLLGGSCKHRALLLGHLRDERSPRDAIHPVSTMEVFGCAGGF